MYDFEDETGAGLGAGVPDENPELERVKQALFDLRDRIRRQPIDKGR